MFPSTEIKASNIVGDSFDIGSYSKRLVALVLFVLYTQMIKNAIVFHGLIKYFSESFHDNGDIDMAATMRLYMENGVNVPIRVDHVPTMPWEQSSTAGYDAIGRLFAIGYLKGIIEGVAHGNL